METNRIKSMTTEEATMFTQLEKMVKENMKSLKVTDKVISGGKKAKFKFILAKNAPYIHLIEFLVKNATEVVALRLVTARTTMETDFYRNLTKLPEAKESYGGIVIHIPINLEKTPEILKQINTLVGKSEEVELDPKRTYSDPPQGWIEGVDGRPSKKDKATKEVAKEESA